MLIAGIIGKHDKERTASLINSIAQNSHKKISTLNSKDLTCLDVETLKDYLLQLERNNIDIFILKLDLPDISEDIYDYLRFDIIVFTDKADEINGDGTKVHVELMRKAFSLLNENGIAIINADDNDLTEFFRGIKHYTVTYGFNLKASVTTSSIGDPMSNDNILCCLQRRIHTRNGSIIEPQEFRVKTIFEDTDPNNILAAAVFALINEIDLE